MPTDFSVAFGIAAAYNPYPQATTVLINGFYPEYGPLISVKTHIICMHPPTIFR